MKKIFVANWKMSLKKEQIAPLIEIIKKADKTKWETAVCPSFVHLAKTAALIRDEAIGLGAQDCFWEERGAYTGEVSAWDLKSEGCEYVLVGHSERRKYFGETDEMVNKKIKAAFAAGLTPILCVGETKEEKDAGETLTRVREQLRKDLSGIALNGGRIIMAYEPVWAIGTGNFCSPEIASEAHTLIKQEVKKNSGVKDAAVLYGGSVDDKNAANFLKQNFIDGVLVGGASTKLETLSGILSQI